MNTVLGAAWSPPAARRSARLKRLAAKRPFGLLLAIMVSGCSAMTPPPRFSAVSPADKDAPEAGTPPPTPALSGEAESREAPAQRQTSPPTQGHESHSYYSCPMHPEVKEKSQGSCPKCGMTLVRRQEPRP